MKRLAVAMALLLGASFLAKNCLAQGSKVKLGDLAVAKADAKDVAEDGSLKVPPLAELEKNVKWVTGIEVIDHDGKGFYETQGWGPNFVIPTRSDIFSPKRTRHSGKDSFDKPIPLNKTTTIKGRAFGGDRGVSKVEISFDNGQTWTQTEIDYPGTRLTWVFWNFQWKPTQAGEYQLICRATDGNGDLQTSEVRGIAPQGATGLHKVKAIVQ